MKKKGKKGKYNLFGFDGKPKDADADAHAVKVRVSEEDLAKFDALPRGFSNLSVPVTDLNTGVRWHVQRADCGARCFCAAQFERAEPLQPARK